MNERRAEAEQGLRPTPFLIRALTGFAALMMFAMMALTFADVVGRYLFNAPIGATFEVIELMMGLLIFSALPLITREEGHITVSLFERFFRGRLQWFQQLFVLLFSSFAVAFLTSRMWSEMLVMRRDQDLGEYIDWELWPFIGVLCALSVISFVILLGLLVRHLKTPYREGPSAGSQSAGPTAP